MRRRRRGRSGVLSRRNILMALGAGVTALGITSSGAFDSVEGNRSAQIGVAKDVNAILALENFKEGVVYEEPNEVTATNQTGEPLDSGSNQVESANGDLKFRQPGTTGRKNPLSLANLSDGDSDSFEIVTPVDKTGEITDTVTLSYSGSNVSITVVRDITVEFNAGAQLVYAVDDNPAKGDIKVYDAVNDVLNDPPQTTRADVVGANAADIVGDSNADIPYAEQNDDTTIYATAVGATSDTAITKNKKPKLKKQKTRFALRPWPGVATLSTTDPLILGANSKSKKILAIDAGGTVEEVASPPDGCGGVCGVKDIDGDGDTELVFVNSSNQLRYLKQDGTVNAMTNSIVVGETESKGFGPPADFGGSQLEVPVVNDNEEPVLVDYQGNQRTLGGSIAERTAITPLDVDGDDENEFMYLDNGKPKIIKYIDDVGGSNTQKELTIDGSTVVPLRKVGLNSGT